MTVSSSESKLESTADRPRRRLIAWPISLVGLTLGLLLMTNFVAACGGHRDRHSIDDVKEHAEEAVDHMMHRLDGSDEQTAEVQTIVAGAIDELAAAHGPRGDFRGQWSALLTAETIDREAMEAMRARHLAKAQAMSEIATNRIADVLEVLSPEQRAELNERFEKRHRRWH